MIFVLDSTQATPAVNTTATVDHLGLILEGLEKFTERYSECNWDPKKVDGMYCGYSNPKKRIERYLDFFKDPEKVIKCYEDYFDEPEKFVEDFGKYSECYDGVYGYFDDIRQNLRSFCKQLETSQHPFPKYLGKTRTIVMEITKQLRICTRIVRIMCGLEELSDSIKYSIMYSENIAKILEQHAIKQHIPASPFPGTLPPPGISEEDIRRGREYARNSSRDPPKSAPKPTRAAAIHRTKRLDRTRKIIECIASNTQMAEEPERIRTKERARRSYSLSVLEVDPDFPEDLMVSLDEIIARRRREKTSE